ncbi:MAG: hypothetical protein JW943_04980 [Deltaproteobacteria bacterium]|nr:hypothetical protein [Deltaproteobacteria bacterium]
MFNRFFYDLKSKGVPVSPKSFLVMQKALSLGAIRSIDDLYTCARAILVKSEKHFDAYDEAFAAYFRSAAAAPDPAEWVDIAEAMIEDWLKNPADIAAALSFAAAAADRLSREELRDLFIKRLQEQNERHDGGEYWIGTKGASLFGNSGANPGAMHVGKSSGSRSAVASALERRYKSYSVDAPLTLSQVGEALKRLRRMTPAGPRDALNIEKTIYETMRSGGEIEIVYDRRLQDRLKVALIIDNGGTSMDAYINTIQVLFSYAHSQFKELNTYYFHNCIYREVWEDAERTKMPVSLAELIRKAPQTRLIIVGDASMALGEIDGSLYTLAKTFPHVAWLNPVPRDFWFMTETIGAIRKILPMFELTLDGLDRAVKHLMRRD